MVIEKEGTGRIFYSLRVRGRKKVLLPVRTFVFFCVKVKGRRNTTTLKSSFCHRYEKIDEVRQISLFIFLLPCFFVLHYCLHVSGGLLFVDCSNGPRVGVVASIAAVVLLACWLVG